jgi:catechol 2,3-dioxygenase-like lactoylglutathione lyase family enzyme
VCRTLQLEVGSGKIVGGQAVLAPDFFPEMQRPDDVEVSRHFEQHLTRDDQILCVAILSDEAARRIEEKLAHSAAPSAAEKGASAAAPTGASVLRMPVYLDHLIVRSTDKSASAAFLAEMLGLPTPTPVGPGGRFHAVPLAGGTSLDFADAGEHFSPQHYAFAVTDPEFDALLARIRERRLPHWADPGQTEPDRVADRGGSRAVYFADPSGHWLEVLTR